MWVGMGEVATELVGWNLMPGESGTEMDLFVCICLVATGCLTFKGFSGSHHCPLL
jgi:hypothetical protein